MKEEVRTQRCEPDDHEAPLSDRVAEVIMGLKARHPCVIQPLWPTVGPGIHPCVGSPEVQDHRYLSPRQVPFPRRPYQGGRSRGIAGHVRTKAWVGSTLNLVPSPELGRVLHYAHRRIYLHGTTYPMMPTARPVSTAPRSPRGQGSAGSGWLGWSRMRMSSTLTVTTAGPLSIRI